MVENIETHSKTVRNLILIWLLWAVILVGYQQYVVQRYQPERPDEVLIWTASEMTRAESDKPFLIDPFLNTQLSWDSEFYLSIAVNGYDDPSMRSVQGDDGANYSLSYAFFPLYPLLMRIIATPFSLLDMTPTAAATLAGVIVSIMGALAGMLALFDILRDYSKDAAYKSVFYLLIFPTSLYFATVYTEGLFVGLAFSSLALMRRDKLLFASILALFATWTRAAGAVLIVPLAMTWFDIYRKSETPDWRVYASGLLVFSPVLAHLIWRMALGEPFFIVQDNWFGNGALDFERAWQAWEIVLNRAREFPETAVHYLLEISIIIVGIVSNLFIMRRYPRIALFGLGIMVLTLSSGWGSSQSISRYVLSVPAVFILLGMWGRNVVFDRAWTLLSVLFLALQAALFSFDMWVA